MGKLSIIRDIALRSSRGIGREQEGLIDVLLDVGLMLTFVLSSLRARAAIVAIGSSIG